MKEIKVKSDGSVSINGRKLKLAPWELYIGGKYKPRALHDLMLRYPERAGPAACCIPAPRTLTRNLNPKDPQHKELFLAARDRLCMLAGSIHGTIKHATGQKSLTSADLPKCITLLRTLEAMCDEVMMEWDDRYAFELCEPITKLRRSLEKIQGRVLRTHTA